MAFSSDQEDLNEDNKISISICGAYLWVRIFVWLELTFKFISLDKNRLSQFVTQENLKLWST